MNQNLAWLYRRSPIFIQNIGISLYGLKIYFREYGNKFKRMLEEFEKNQWFSHEQLRIYQDKRLGDLIAHCYENVPYYREIMDSRKLKPSDIRTVSDLNKMPVLTRDDVRCNVDKLIAGNYKRSRLAYGHTSGTTGSPLAIAWDNYTCLVKNVLDWRQKLAAGINPYDKLAYFFYREVTPIEQKRPPFWRHNWVLNHIFFSIYHLSQENLDKYATKLESFRPKAIEGYPSTIYIVASYLLKRKKMVPMKAVFCTSEPLMPYQRETIERAFGCKVFDSYGMSERVIYATECPVHSGLHINSDFGVTEILSRDNRNVSAGEMGRIVATGLHNYAMPLIRYQTTDITALNSTSCSCGRNFPLMAGVTARDVETITTKDGRYISWAILDGLCDHMTTVSEFQFIQESRELIRMKIIKYSNYTDKDTEYILNGMKRILGEGMTVELEFVDSIPRTKSGKFRLVISKVPLEF